MDLVQLPGHGYIANAVVFAYRAQGPKAQGLVNGDGDGLGMHFHAGGFGYGLPQAQQGGLE